MQRHIRDGIYPTMIAPYASDGRLDEEALRKLVRWYGRKGCQGFFAACQSSEVFYLSMEERKKMVEVVKDEASRQEEGRETRQREKRKGGEYGKREKI